VAGAVRAQWDSDNLIHLDVLQIVDQKTPVGTVWVSIWMLSWRTSVNGMSMWETYGFWRDIFQNVWLHCANSGDHETQHCISKWTEYMLVYHSVLA